MIPAEEVYLLYFPDPNRAILLDQHKNKYITANEIKPFRLDGVSNRVSLNKDKLKQLLTLSYIQTLGLFKRHLVIACIMVNFKSPLPSKDK